MMCTETRSTHILHAAEAEGFACTYKVINAADFGVPQIRERLFIVGVRVEATSSSRAHSSQPRGWPDLFGSPLPMWRTAGEAISDLDTDENADDDGHFAGGRHHDLLGLIPPGTTTCI